MRRLFVAGAKITETAHEAAIAGQSEALIARAYVEKARRLEAAARSLAALTEAAAVIAGPSTPQRCATGAVLEPWRP